MKYTTENALKEIKRRARRIRQKRERRITNILATAACLCLIVLLAVINAFSSAGIVGMQTEYGATILPTETGKYVLIAALGFVLGALATLTIKRLKN